MSGLEKDLDKEVADFRSHTFAKSTQQSYNSYKKSYCQFCLQMGYSPAPTTTLNLCRYIAYLARRLSANSIPKYLQIIRLIHLDLGFPNPLENNFVVTSLLKGICRVKGTDVHRKLPITPEILLKVRSQLDLSVSDDIVFWAICLTMFFGFLRKANVLGSGPGVVTRDDFVLNDWGFMLSVSHTKTIQCKERVLQIPYVLNHHHPLCPCTALLAAFVDTVGADPKKSAFVSPTSRGFRPFSPNHFVEKLRTILCVLGYPSISYSGHSFRRGAASWGLNIGLPADVIQILGDWSSDAYKVYLEVPLSSKIKLVQRFTSAMPTS